jgi:hypothetical protein
MTRVSGIGAVLVAFAGILVVLVTPGFSAPIDGVEAYCCVCNSCTAGASVQCISVLADGSKEADWRVVACTSLADVRCVETGEEE